MTSPPSEPSPKVLSETVAALAVQIAALRGQVSLINKRLDQAGLKGDLGLAARFEELARTVAAALDTAAPRGPAALRWDAMDKETRSATLADLAEWVRTVLLAGYPDCGLPECWGNHPQAVTELGNIWAEWRHIYEQKRPPLALTLDWHDRWLPNATRRISEITRRCVGECSARRSAGNQPGSWRSY
jgi:hypothetical protein